MLTIKIIKKWNLHLYAHNHFFFFTFFQVSLQKLKFAFFYLFTTIHGLHIIGGIYFWGKTTSKFIKRSLKKEEINNLIDICAVYWHFLLAVWLVLFGLMLSS